MVNAAEKKNLDALRPMVEQALATAFLAARDAYYSALGPGSELKWDPEAEQKRALEERRAAIDDLFTQIESAEPHPGFQRGKVRP